MGCDAKKRPAEHKDPPGVSGIKDRFVVGRPFEGPGRVVETIPKMC
jgi:hypothetical protein